MKSIFLIISFLFFSLAASALHSLKPLWQSDSVFQFAEGVISAKKGKHLFVANTIGNPIERDAKGTISTVTPDGRMIKLTGSPALMHRKTLRSTKTACMLPTWMNWWWLM